MITNIKSLEKYCKDYKNIENYEDAVKSPLRYDLHHRLEIDEMQSASDLIAENLYYYRPPEELIFLEHRDHCRLHQEGKHLSAETRQRMSDALKGKQNALGHHWNPSAETRQRMSDAHKGRLASEDTRKKMSEAMKGKHWHLENGKHVYTN